MGTPCISVIMPVYNGEKYLRPAIESILGQTFTDFEFLIIDDGSTDSSVEICSSYRDPRIRLLSNGHNLGLIATLNRGLELARGEYIARMDCDDISLPERLERQLAFLNRHPDVGLCGTWFERFYRNESIILKPPTDDRLIRFFLLFDNAFAHNTIVMRKDFVQRYGLRYDPEYKYSEDYEFWVRCAQHTKVANIPEVLVRYRFHPENTSNRFRREQDATADRIRRRQLEALAVAASEEEIALHNAITTFRFHGDHRQLLRAKTWLEKLLALGVAQGALAEAAACRYLSRFWYGACGKSADLGWPLWRLFCSSPIGRAAEREWRWKLLLRCLLRRPIPLTGSAAGP
ncbi:glycosyltransferase family 2 protein [Candidatus Methylocalor cossyra]|uniref:Glycosyl transferase, group 2 family protein n=1 Tax=Candidatus Methylocalor cossyra TaxID=3108543 RepID=A0ABP1CC31_9GAMM